MILETVNRSELATVILGVTWLAWEGKSDWLQPTMMLMAHRQTLLLLVCVTLAKVTDFYYTLPAKTSFPLKHKMANLVKGLLTEKLLTLWLLSMYQMYIKPYNLIPACGLVSQSSCCTLLTVMQWPSLMSTLVPHEERNRCQAM